MLCSLCSLFINGSRAADPTAKEPSYDKALITSATKELDSGLAGELQKIVVAHQGVMGIYCRHLGTSETIEVNPDEAFPTASTIKLAVMCAALYLLAKETGPFKDYYDTRKYDAATSTGGSGFLRNYKDGTPMELKELVHLMITVSDNIATNMICEWITLDKVNEWLSQKGLEQTRIFSTVGGSSVVDADGRKTWGLGRTTPREIGTLLEMIVSGKAGTPATTDEMLRLLGHQYFDGNIPAAIPPMTYVGSKGGAVSDSRSDTAIVVSPGGTYVLAVYTKDNEDKSWTGENKAEAAIREVSRQVWRHFNPDSHWERPAGSEKF